jgi:DNA (cytosine-5)-methyltransferase 1
VTTLDPNAYGPLDAIVGGFPCQDVSNAGHRAGLSGSRSGLYGEVVRCLRVARPRVGILENVAALLARGMGTVLGDLAAIGYDAEWDCIPASAVGAPHRRDRVFIIAHRREERVSRMLPQTVRWVPEFSWCKNVRGIEELRKRSPVPTPIFCGGRDGIPHWVDRVGACGNAVVPQVAEAVGRAVMKAIGVAGDCGKPRF